MPKRHNLPHDELNAVDKYCGLALLCLVSSLAGQGGRKGINNNFYSVALYLNVISSFYNTKTFA